jgi:hypothetical protein
MTVIDRGVLELDHTFLVEARHVVLGMVLIALTL